jgi:hypothetical protein
LSSFTNTKYSVLVNTIGGGLTTSSLSSSLMLIGEKGLGVAIYSKNNEFGDFGLSLVPEGVPGCRDSGLGFLESFAGEVSVELGLDVTLLWGRISFSRACLMACLRA